MFFLFDYRASKIAIVTKLIMISSSEPQVQVSFSITCTCCPFVCLSVCLSVCNLCTFFTSSHELVVQITQHWILSFLMETDFSMVR